MTHKGSWQRPDDGNYGKGFDGIDWSAKGGVRKEQCSTEAQAAPEAEEKTNPTTGDVNHEPLPHAGP